MFLNFLFFGGGGIGGHNPPKNLWNNISYFNSSVIKRFIIVKSTILRFHLFSQGPHLICQNSNHSILKCLTYHSYSRLFFSSVFNYLCHIFIYLCFWMWLSCFQCQFNQYWELSHLSQSGLSLWSWRDRFNHTAMLSWEAAWMKGFKGGPFISEWFHAWITFLSPVEKPF